MYTHQERVERAQRVLDFYLADKGEEEDLSNMIDLLPDLAHWHIATPRQDWRMNTSMALNHADYEYEQEHEEGSHV